MAHKQLAEHTVEERRTFGPFKRTGWAIGWDIGFYEGEPMVSRFGSYDATRSHLSYLPNRKIGVVAMTTSPLASRLTDIVASYAYDLEAGRTDALERANTALAAITDRFKTLPTQLAATEATRAARQKPLPHPLATYTGTFDHPGYGPMTWSVRDGRLWYAFGAFSGPVEIYDTEKNQFRADYAGGGSVATFVIDADGRASEVVFDEVRFVRR
jgi:hypothetical protein